MSALEEAWDEIKAREQAAAEGGTEEDRRHHMLDEEAMRLMLADLELEWDELLAFGAAAGDVGAQFLAAIGEPPRPALLARVIRDVWIDGAITGALAQKKAIDPDLEVPRDLS